ncbi:MAG: NUDIX hydrolase [Chloroflexi bacterium]|nr:NUDIX hydrolase [Chloroflexota bacterium]
MAEPETTVSSERVFEGRRLSVRVDRVRLADGTEAVREVAEHPNAVVIVAVDGDQNLLLVRQYRFAVARELLELPAGLIENGDAPIATAQRELREETGFAAAELTELGHFYAAPGGLTECLYAFLGTGLTHDPLAPDADERIELVRMGFREALDMARAGGFHDAKTIASLLLAERRVLG